MPILAIPSRYFSRYGPTSVAGGASFRSSAVYSARATSLPVAFEFRLRWIPGFSAMFFSFHLMIRFVTQQTSKTSILIVTPL